MLLSARAPFVPSAVQTSLCQPGRELSNAADEVPDGGWANCRAIVLGCGNLPPFAIGRAAPKIEQELLLICPPVRLVGLLLA